MPNRSGDDLRDTDLDRHPPGKPVALSETLAAPPTATGAGPPSRTFARNTVLPRATPAATADKPRFQPLDRLGEGGIGEVVLVEDQDIERKVAIKRLRPERRDDAASLRRFAEEVRIIGQLEHPNITPVHDVGVDEEGHHYFVMKYVEGETLETVIERLREHDPEYERRFPYDVRVEIFLGMLNAVAYAHARGVLHRDIKPANIMVGPYGEVTIMDWGIAKRVGSSDARETQDGALLGTPMYMSPEQAGGEHATIDARSDVFSLSLVFFELMTLKHPLADKKTVQQVIAQLVSHGIDRNCKVAFIKSGAPGEYGDLVQRGLAHDRERRFPSVKAMADQLHRARAGNFPITCHVTFGRRAAAATGIFITRHPLIYTLLLAAAILGLVYFVIINIVRLL
jgi:eukaryotic-like serine/threonine-protein kinase